MHRTANVPTARTRVMNLKVADILRIPSAEHVAGCSPPGGRLFLCQLVLVHHELGLEGCFIRLDACRGRNEFARAMATLRILS